MAGWNGNRVVGVDMGSPHAATHYEAQAPPAATAARHSNHPTLDPDPRCGGNPRRRR